MNTKKFIACITILFIVITSCKKTSTSGACTNSFTFLKNGAALTYKDFDLFGDTIVVTTTYDSTSTPGVFLETVQDVTDNSSIGQRYMKGCNGWLLDDVKQNVNDTLRYIKENRSVNDSWTYYDPQYADYNTYTVAQTNVSITVPAGTFVCDKLLFYQQGTINTDTLWWNNTYSIIKYDGFLESYYLTSRNY